MRAYLVLLLLACALGCLAPDAEPEAPRIISKNPGLSSCNNRSTFEAREQCYFEQASERRSPDLCMEISQLKQRNLCLRRIGAMVKDPTVCLKIKKDDAVYTDCIIASTVS